MEGELKENGRLFFCVASSQKSKRCKICCCHFVTSSKIKGCISFFYATQRDIPLSIGCDSKKIYKNQAQKKKKEKSSEQQQTRYE